MVTLGDLIRFRASERQGLMHVGEVVGKRRSSSTGKRVYDVYGLEPVPGSSDRLYRYKSEVEEIPAERVFVRVRNDGNYHEAWSKLGWIQMGRGETSVFSPVPGSGPPTVPEWGLVISDSDDPSTDDSSSSGSETEDDLDVESVTLSMNATDTDYEPSVEETESDFDENDLEFIAEDDASVAVSNPLTNEERFTLTRLRADADRAFRDWIPETPGERRFKDAISRIETRARRHLR